MDYGEAIDYLMSFTDFERGYQASKDPAMSLESVRSLLQRLNDPQRGRGTVHVTGSKGKGSTASMIAGILRRSDLRTSLFTSPHLHAFTERIAIDGEAISPEEFATGLAAIQPAIEEERTATGGNVSTFGILTALFFWLTRAQAPRVDWQVVEVGLGGTFDATNVFDAPDVCVITPISLEHTAILGSTTEAIARDKSGIIKAGSTCVLGPQKDPAVVEVVRQRCASVGAELVDVGASYRTEVREKFPFGQSFRLHGPEGMLEMRTPMLGRYQLDNAATAVAAGQALARRGHAVSQQSIIEGIAHTRVPGRLEVMSQRPLILADGAHNPDSADALAEAVHDYFEWKRCFLVVGAMSDKDIRGIGLKLARFAELIVCCRLGSPRAMDPYQMIQEIGFLGPAAVAEESVADGLETALSHASPEDLVLVTGSLYAVSEARAHVLGESVVSQ